MKILLLSCLIQIFFLFPVIHGIAIPTSPPVGQTSGEEYKLQECNVIKECTACSFMELKMVKECLINGNIETKKCVSVNVKDPKDTIEQEFYESCLKEGYNQYTIYIFFLGLFVFLYIFIVLLMKYRKRLQVNMYKRLSIKSAD